VRGYGADIEIHAIYDQHARVPVGELLQLKRCADVAQLLLHYRLHLRRRQRRAVDAEIAQQAVEFTRVRQIVKRQTEWLAQVGRKTPQPLPAGLLHAVDVTTVFFSVARDRYMLPLLVSSRPMGTPVSF